jgi:hypothetical protein
MPWSLRWGVTIDRTAEESVEKSSHIPLAMLAQNRLKVDAVPAGMLGISLAVGLRKESKDEPTRSRR